MACRPMPRLLAVLACALFLLALARPSSAVLDPLFRAKELTERIFTLSRAGKYAEALPLAAESLALLEKELGPESPEVAATLTFMAGFHDALEQYAQAVPLYERALRLKEKHFGPEHLETAKVAGALAWDLDSLGELAKARPLYERALAIREKVQGPEHPDTAVALNNLAALLDGLGEHAQAVPLYERSLAINEKRDPNSPDTANSLNNLANTLSSLAEYAKAKPLFERALAIQEKTLGPEHPKLAATLNNLAQLDKARGDFEEARRLLERSLAIREKTLGSEHPDTAMGLNNLAGLFDSLGEYDQAKPLYERALGILEKRLGSGHPLVASCLGNLASVLCSLGDFDTAKPLIERALAIREKVFGPQSQDVALSLNNLALWHYAQNDFAKAKPLLERTLAILEKTAGPEHPLTATALNSLAGAHFSLNDLPRAKALNERSLAIREKTLGPDHLETAISLHNLAGVHLALGDGKQAEAFFRKALALMTQALGPNHPNAAKVLNNLARLKARTWDFGQAFALMREAQAIDAAAMDRIMAVTSEAQKLKYLSVIEASLHDFLSLAVERLTGDAAARRAALDVWLARKGVVLEAQRRFQEALFYDDDPKAAQLSRDLAEVRGQLSRLTFAGPGLLPAEAFKEKSAALARRSEEIEASLAGLSSRYAQSRKRAAATADSLGQALPAGSALVELARCEVSDFTAAARKTGTFRYLAFTLAAGKDAAVGMVDLGDAAMIDRAALDLKKALLRAPAERGEVEAAGRALHDLVFAPLRQALGPIRTVFISPDGALSLLPFEILLGPDQRFLIEDFTFNYLAAGRDILGFGESLSGEPTAKSALLLGDPDFDRAEDATPAPALNATEPSGAPERRRSANLRGLRFGRLPGSRQEIEALAGLLGPGAGKVYLGAAANEAALSSTKTPRILHLATHGFFLADQPLAALAEASANPARGFAVLPAQDFRLAPSSNNGFENPLLRSGLALAGANAALSSADPQDARGIVTAEKILDLDLRGTEMVTLSACETGLGEVRAGEGVFGLRRAFARAGAKSLVMSLWSVPDLETKELMIAFYAALAKGGLSRCQALRQAALAEMETARGRHGWASPFYWGAFVFLGQP